MPQKPEGPRRRRARPNLEEPGKSDTRPHDDPKHAGRQKARRALLNDRKPKAANYSEKKGHSEKKGQQKDTELITRSRGRWTDSVYPPPSYAVADRGMVAVTERPSFGESLDREKMDDEAWFSEEAPPSPTDAAELDDPGLPPLDEIELPPEATRGQPTITATPWTPDPVSPSGSQRPSSGFGRNRRRFQLSRRLEHGAAASSRGAGATLSPLSFIAGQDNDLELPHSSVEPTPRSLKVAAPQARHRQRAHPAEAEQGAGQRRTRRDAPPQRRHRSYEEEQPDEEHVPYSEPRPYEDEQNESVGERAKGKRRARRDQRRSQMQPRDQRRGTPHLEPDDHDRDYEEQDDEDSYDDDVYAEERSYDEQPPPRQARGRHGRNRRPRQASRRESEREDEERWYDEGEHVAFESPTSRHDESPPSTSARERLETMPSRDYDETLPSRPEGPNDGEPFQVLPIPRLPPGVVTPRMTAIFGALVGVAVVASIVALLIRVFPTEDQRSAADALGDATASAKSARKSPTAKNDPKKRERNLLPEPWRVKAMSGTHKMTMGATERRSFIKLLTENGVDTGQVYRIMKAFDGVRSFDRTGRKDQYVVALNRKSREVEGFEYIVSPTEVYQAKVDETGHLVGKKLDMKVQFEDYAAGFYIGKDIKKSYRDAGFEPGLLSEIDKAFNGRTSSEGLKEGGVVRIVATEQTALGRFVRYKNLKIIEYRPPEPGAKPIRAYWHEGVKGGVYVDTKGRRPSNKGYRNPVPGAPITSHFNPKRMHPILKRPMPHNGTDYGAASGTPIYAAYRGVVRHLGMLGANGNLVTVEHPDGVTTGYAHMSRYAKGLKAGDRVATRQLIGYIGTTGRSTGPHLHLSAKRNGKFFNALDLKFDAIKMLPINDRSAFNLEKQTLDQALERIPLPEPPPPEPEPTPEPNAMAGDNSDSRPDAANDKDTADNDPDDEDRDPEPSEDDGDDDRGRASSKGNDDDSGGGLLGEDLSGDIE